MSSTKSVKFEFTDASTKNSFVIELNEQEKIEHARKILCGDETNQIHIQGVVIKTRASYNPNWSYHLEPNSIEFVENSIELCDSTIELVENNLVDVGGAFLPNNHWCPWSSELVREL